MLIEPALINIQKQLIYNELDKLPVLQSNKIKKDYFDQKIVDQMLMEYDNCDLISVPSNFTKNSFKQFNFDKKVLLNQITPEKALQINESQNISNPSF